MCYVLFVWSMPVFPCKKILEVSTEKKKRISLFNNFWNIEPFSFCLGYREVHNSF